MKKYWNEQDLAAIKSSIHKAELLTSTEIVPLVAETSDAYWWVHWVWTISGWAMGTLWFEYRSHHLFLEATDLVLFQGTAMILAFALSFIPAIKRNSIPRRWITQSVHRQALADFLTAGLTGTRDRTAVLIYLSVFERRVNVIVDIGISAKIPNVYWEQTVQEIIRGIRSGKSVGSLCLAIETIGEKLAENFPRRTDDTNEIKDAVLFGHRPEGEER
jgi:putative membrane protein